MKGLFITVEGPDGAGKTSVIQALLPRLQEAFEVPIISTREPGGSRIAERIRSIILDVEHTEMDNRTEAILYAAARRQHLVDRILPNLEVGNIVICDRFVDSSIVYQGVARGLGKEEVRQLNLFATEGLLPKKTIYLDVPAEVGIERIHKARGNRQFDRLDQEELSFHKMVRQGYLDLIQEDPERFIMIDTRQDLDKVVEEVYQEIKHEITKFLMQ
ncbi:dTMP kinase [Granulicatella seriolae]|uniref:Thymidylate kinase n=1 Tax=Granulicatella seriolae TaxID=2967226 RepID=A0ABT1WPI0_9LACT|nr:dTMP kinase [Granulicatella seriolae]